MPEVTTHAQLLRSGMAADEVRRMARAGALVRVRRGAYISAGPAPDRTTEHRRLIEATAAQSMPGAVASHVSSAVMRDLPVPYADLSRVHLTRDREGGGRARRFVQVHGAPLGADEVTEVRGIPVTTLPRTFVDVARTGSLRTSVALGDAMLRSGTTAAELEQAVRRSSGRHGIAAARRAFAALDARAESPGESVSRVVIAQLGFPPPQPQLVLHDDTGEFVARVDFAWPELGVVGEFDGRVKYGRTLRDADPVEVLWSEKLREDQIRQLGWLVVRWTWTDLDDPTGLARRLRQAFLRGHAIG